MRKAERYPCQFIDNCRVAEDDMCMDPDFYNSAESMCPIYYRKVRKVIHKDKEKERIDKAKRERRLLLQKLGWYN